MPTLPPERSGCGGDSQRACLCPSRMRMGYIQNRKIYLLRMCMYTSAHMHQLLTQKQWGPSPAVGEVPAVQAEMSGGLGRQRLEAEFRLPASD